MATMLLLCILINAEIIDSVVNGMHISTRGLRFFLRFCCDFKFLFHEKVCPRDFPHGMTYSDIKRPYFSATETTLSS